VQAVELAQSIPGEALGSKVRAQRLLAQRLLNGCLCLRNGCLCLLNGCLC